MKRRFDTERLGKMPGGRAFSLVEILVVLSIIAVLMLLAVPAVEQMLKGSRVTVAGNLLVDQLNLAQQTAISTNQPVEVRIYKLPKPTSDPLTGALEEVRAIQVFKCKPDGTVEPADKPIFFPSGIVIVPNVAASSMLEVSDSDPNTPDTAPFVDGAEHTSADSDPVITLPRYDTNYSFRTFRFRSNGETDMRQVPAFLSLVTETDPIVDAGTGLRKNYVTVQVDPVNGRTRLYRP